jgi:hypothetical protein
MVKKWQQSHPILWHNLASTSECAQSEMRLSLRDLQTIQV